MLKIARKHSWKSKKSAAFFPQDLFHTLLILERKRCERSGARFGLALIDVSKLDGSIELRDTLASYLRKTDIEGWYREGEILGVILTTVDQCPIQDLRSILYSKIAAAVQGRAPFSLHIFPEDITNELFPEPHITGRNTTFHIIKRTIDVSVSLSALIFLSPIYLIIAMLVKLSSPGPVFFKQKRLGFMAKQFDFLKFRTMYDNNDPEIHKKYVASLIENQKPSAAAGVFKIQNDPRVTRIGRFLRKSSLDEIPQFLNVLRGEMSLVGPRPPIPYEVDKYRSWHKRRIFEVKPGITGLWQVYGRSRTTFDEMVRLDIRYINEQSIWLDFIILIQTPRVVLFADGAY
jgi:lipopolysaccharide/colanic/teichoic acid biosynthesis glycosyltransferase